MKATYKVSSQIILVGLILIALFPFYWAISCSLKSEQAIFAIPPEWWPTDPTLGNFAKLFARTSFFKWLFNSAFVSTCIVIGVCAVSCLSAYSFAKIRFPHSNTIFIGIILTMMVPKYILMVPLFRQLMVFDWINDYRGLIIPEIAAQIAFGTFLLRQFMVDVPSEIIEAARIDGCGELRILGQIVIPLAKPAVTSLAIITFVKAWNDYMWQLIVATSNGMKTLPLGIASLNTETHFSYGLILGGAILSALPLIIIFIVFQKYFTKGLTAGAVKG